VIKTEFDPLSFLNTMRTKKGIKSPMIGEKK
jgi:hypothetical protein